MVPRPDLPVIPIFPLPGIVFLPSTRLPLHIFEPRYRAMVAAARETDGLIGMIQLDDGWEAAREPKPVRPLGCAGRIADFEALDDGRSNIVLEGAWGFRVVEELPHHPYRVARVEPLAAAGFDVSDGARGRLRREIVGRLAQLSSSMGWEPGRVPPAEGLADEALVHAAALALEPDPDDGYRLLGMERLEERSAWVLGTMQSMQSRLDLLAPFRGRQRPDRN